MHPKIEEYLDYLRAVRGLSDRTIRSYREDLDRFSAHLGGGDPDEAVAGDIGGHAGALITQGHAASSVNRALSSIRGFYRYRLRFGIIGSDPSRDIENLPADRPLPRFLFAGEIESMLGTIRDDGFARIRERALIEVLYSTGCRVAETAGMTMGRLDLANGTARVTGKGSKERIVFLSRSAREAVAAYLPYRAARLKAPAAESGGGDSPLFLNSRGGALSVRSIERIVEGRALAAGMRKRVSPHAFRHSFASRMVGNGADIRVVQEFLGHASVTTTQVYTHLDMEHLRNVYEYAHPHGSGDSKKR